MCAEKSYSRKYSYIVTSPSYGEGVFDAAFCDLDAPDMGSRYIHASFCEGFPHLLHRTLYHIGALKCDSKDGVLAKGLKSLLRHCEISRIRRAARTMNITDGKLCLVVGPEYYAIGTEEIVRSLRKDYPNLRMVYYFTDLVSRDPARRRICTQRGPDAELIASYDPADAETCGLLYCPMPYSGMSEAAEDAAEPAWDVSFAGQAKGRLDLIREAYQELTANGLKCRFYVVGSGNRPEGLPEGIIYTRNFLPYKEYLAFEKDSRCILEIIQGDSVGQTTRVAEAVFLGKKLLTNNTSFKNSPYYDEANMFIFDTPDVIDPGFVLDSRPAAYSAELRERFDPQAFLQKIDEAL